MKNFIIRMLSLTVSMVMCLSFASVAFAAEPTYTVGAGNAVVASANEGDIMPLGKIDGYSQMTVTSTNNTVVVWCDSSAIFNSGMGITIKASHANFDGYVTVKGYPKVGTAEGFSSRQLHMGTEIKIDNLTHRGCDAYQIEFNGLKAGQSFLAQVWIYG